MTLSTYDPAPDEAALAQEPNALEALVMAHRENVHSAMLAWLLRTSELPLEIPVQILAELAGPLGIVPIKVATRTEWNDLDILAEVEDADGRTAVIAIEHKIKAREHDHQLDNYDRHLSDRGSHVLAKLFLTFLGDPPRGGQGWQGRSYIRLLRALEAAEPKAAHNRYLDDYTILIRRLVAAQRLAVEVPAYARCIFGDEPLPDDRPVEAFAEYIDRCRLRVTLQRAWLGEVARQLDLGSWSNKTDETNGVGLLDLAQTTSRRGARVRFGLQLQNWQLKAFAHPWPYIEGPSPAQKDAVETVLNEIQCVLGLGSVRPSVGRGRGFRSVAVANLRADADRYEVRRWVQECACRLPALATVGAGA